MNVRSQALKRQTKRPCAVTARLKSCPSLKPRASHSSNGVRSASFYPERPSLSAEPASAPNLPQHRTQFGATTSQYCESTRNVILELRRLRGECLPQPSDAGASDGCEFQNSLLIHCYSLLFLARKNREFP